MVEADLDGFWKLVDEGKLCVVTTRQGNALRSRPMVADIDRATHEFRFLTRLSMHNTDELAANPDVNIAFGGAEGRSHVSVSGQAYLTQDRHLLHELWSRRGGTDLGMQPDDPEIAVIRVVPAKAEIWDGNGQLGATWNLFKPRVPAADAAPQDTSEAQS